MEVSENFRRQATAAVVWSFILNWGSRALGLVIFVLLARLLNPQEYGIAGAGFLILSLLMVIAEFGLGDALVQRRDFTTEDANGPFFVSLGLSVLLSVLTFWFSDRLATLMSIEGAGHYIAVIGLLSPVLMLSGFQEAMYRREMMFRALSIRGLVCLAIGGIVGVAVAKGGGGPWAVIAQYGSQVVSSTIWIWIRPVWLPKFEFNGKSTREILAFGIHLVAQRLIDFGTLRSVSFIILIYHGPAPLALFNVASRITYILLELIQGSVNSASTVILSKLSGDMERMRKLYLRVCSIVSTFGTPIFFGLAAASLQLNTILFGNHWAGAELLMKPMLLLGGIYCVQFINGSYLIAMGKPKTFMWLIVFKAAVVLPTLYFIKMDTVEGTVWLYCAALLAETPFMFHFTIRSLSIRWTSLVKPIGAPLLCASLSFMACEFAQKFSWAQISNPFIGGIIQGGIFVAIYALLTSIFNLNNLKENIAFTKNRINGV